MMLELEKRREQAREEERKREVNNGIRLMKVISVIIFV